MGCKLRWTKHRPFNPGNLVRFQGDLPDAVDGTTRGNKPYDRKERLPHMRG